MALHRHHIVAACFLLFGFLAFTSEAIKCYECSSERDYNCGDPFNYTHFPLADCEHKRSYSTYSQTYGVCRKTVLRVNGGDRVVERQCAFERPGERQGPCALSSSPYSTVEHCSTCHYDACNSALHVSPPGRLATLAFTLCFLAAKYL